MPEPAEQFAIDPQAAALALLLAEAAARNVLDLRDDRPAGTSRSSAARAAAHRCPRRRMPQP
jgi:hypothetical protein